MDDTLWIYFEFSKTLYSELNHFNLSERHLQIELITYGYCKNDKVYHLLWNAEGSQNFNIFPFVFYGFKCSHRKYLRWRYLRDVYAREDESSRLEKIVYRTAVLTLFCIGIIGMVKWRKMRWQDVALIGLMKNVCTKSIWKLCGKVRVSHIGESAGHSRNVLWICSTQWQFGVLLKFSFPPLFSLYLHWSFV